MTETARLLEIYVEHFVRHHPGGLAAVRAAGSEDAAVDHVFALLNAGYFKFTHDGTGNVCGFTLCDPPEPLSVAISRPGRTA